MSGSGEIEEHGHLASPENEPVEQGNKSQGAETEQSAILADGVQPPESPSTTPQENDISPANPDLPSTQTTSEENPEPVVAERGNDVVNNSAEENKDESPEEANQDGEETVVPKEEVVKEEERENKEDAVAAVNEADEERNAVAKDSALPNSESLVDENTQVEQTGHVENSLEVSSENKKETSEDNGARPKKDYGGDKNLDAGDVKENFNDNKSMEMDATSAQPSTSAPDEEIRVQPVAMATSPSTEIPVSSVYHVKWIYFHQQSVPIITQNENGPCPLLAIMNVLLLKERVKLPPMLEMVTSEQLMDYLGDCILQNTPENITEELRINYEQNIQDAMSVFHKLQTGLDVNVKFTSVNDFEYTPECIVFDLLSIPLYHGWLVDPESPEVSSAVGSCSYNQLVEKIIHQKQALREELVTEAMIAEDFLEKSASQLTYHGLSELASRLKDQELCVFFRNNHFSTLLKHKDELFLLVTDQGFLTESSMVWETLYNVEGDGHFVDAEFRTYRKPEVSTDALPASDVTPGSDQQIDHDYLVALSLQQEQQDNTTNSASGSGSTRNETTGGSTTGGKWPYASQLSDHELAMELQEEERRQAALQQQQQQQQPEQGRQTGQASRQQSQQSQHSRKKSDCVIL